MSAFLPTFGVVLILISSLTLLISQNWRTSMVALAAQYVGVFILVSGVWSPGLSMVKLVTGWMAGAVLMASQPVEELREERFAGLNGTLFRLFAGLALILLVGAVMPVVAQWIPAQADLLRGALLLTAMGLLHLGMTTRPVRVILGLLTALAGFELVYAAVESSVLVAGLLALVNLGLAMTGAYLMTAPGLGETE